MPKLIFAHVDPFVQRFAVGHSHEHYHRKENPWHYVGQITFRDIPDQLNLPSAIDILACKNYAKLIKNFWENALYVLKLSTEKARKLTTFRIILKRMKGILLN